nr:PKD domain-containing protein [Halobacterium noricense]
MFTACLVIAAVTTAGIAPTNGTATANEAPLADAGLDQTVTRATTVYLDAGGSRDPDGTIRHYEWTVTAESGDATNATTPQCQNCQQTNFEAEATGTYRVTLKVIDDDGATANDTLYVTVEPGDPPAVSLAGPTATTTSEPVRFTADANAGNAPLDRLVWRVDGERVTTDAIAGDANTTTRTVRFPTTGTHAVSVTVIDEDGQRDNAKTSISVTEPSNTGTTTGGSGGNPDNADIVGPQLVTGHGELVADYELTNGVSGSWFQDGRRVGIGTSTTRLLTAGTHELYAATDAGVATFADGSRTIVADPAPKLTTVEVENASVVPVTIDATDDYGNLHTVTVHVDGESVETHTTDNLGGRVSGDSLTTITYLESLEPGTHTITVRARDARGQTDVAIRTVNVPGPPEVVSAGFVQEGPLDQYHPRIDESRYTATYRVKVDLNGVEPDEIESTIRMPGTKWSSNLIKESKSENMLVLKKSTYRDEVRPIESSSKVAWRIDDYTNRTNDSIQVTFAPPEIQIETVDPQTEHNRIKGMVLDAGGSFDPDGSPVDYHWQGVDSNQHEDSQIALSATSVIWLQVVDGQHQKTNSSGLLDWFAPDLIEATIEDTGPFYPNETVTVSVYSERYYLTKMTYENATSFKVRPERGYVTDHTLFKEQPGELDDPDPEAMGRHHRWTVEIPAKAFRDGPINLSSYPTEHPHMEYNTTVPQPVVYASAYREVTDVSTTISYLVERPEYTNRRTTNGAVRDNLMDSGYEVRQVDDTGREYQLEKYVKTNPAKYDVDQTRFYEQGRRGFFLESNPEWSAKGTTTETQTWTTTETEWRSDRGGTGTFTGDTRQQKIRDARYRTEKKYSYETTEYYETSVSYEDTYTTTETEIVLKEKCGMFGCMVYQTRETVEEEHTVTRTKEVTRSRTVEETYWSTRPRSITHDYTGELRRVTVREPEYERQYEYEVERQHSKTRTVYLAENRTLVEPASYEWQPWKTVHGRFQAQSAAKSADVHISGISLSKQWTLSKQTGTKTVETSSPRDRSSVSRTIGRADVTLTKYYAREGTKQLPEMESQDIYRTVKHTEGGLFDVEKIEDILTEKVEEKYGE